MATWAGYSEDGRDKRTCHTGQTHGSLSWVSRTWHPLTFHDQTSHVAAPSVRCVSMGAVGQEREDIGWTIK